MRSAYLAGLAGTISLMAWATNLAAEPAACRSPNPGDWPAPAMPYFMLVLDSSGSMAYSLSPAPSCADYPTTYSGHARCAVTNTIKAFSGLVNLGLAEFAGGLRDCGTTCFGDCEPDRFPGDWNHCGLSDGIAVDPPGGSSYSDSVRQRRGANVLVPIDPDDAEGSVPDLLSWVDNVCTGNQEVAQHYNTPLGGSLRDVYRYFRYGWTRPGTTIAFDSPLRTTDPTCQSVNVILLTDGDETCDDYVTEYDPGPAVEAAAALLAGFRLDDDDPDRPLRSIRTYVINFQGGTQSSTDAIADAGGTDASLFATNETELAAALADIIADAIQPEVCDNEDNNCNGCTDEGYRVYCSRNWETDGCCEWTTYDERDLCLDAYKATISDLLPQGDRTELPCWDPSTDGDDPEHKWLCVDPGEVCDEEDNNCEWDYNQDPSSPGRTSEVDEGFKKCPACPSTEVCDGQDNDCNNQVDELPECNDCVPSSEICDGRDNDCDGFIDEADDNASDITIPCSVAGTPGCQGVRTCDHRWTSLDGAPLEPGAVLDPPNGYSPCDVTTSDEICDGLDNDCDGFIDEDVAGTPCEPTIPSGRDAGDIVYQDATHPYTVCKRGQIPCNSVVCQGAKGPQTEVCDGLDNDCDGLVDVAWDGSDLPYVGDACGPCDAGTKACIDGHLQCQYDGAPPQEICNGLDDDCDGIIDDPPFMDAPADPACWPVDAGECEESEQCEAAGAVWCTPEFAECQGLGDLLEPCALGTLTCHGAEGWLCDQGKLPGAEICDGVDNDCDGETDEDLSSPVGDACGNDEGICELGVLVCEAGVLVCTGQGPRPELCNGLDDDCNGEVDDGLPLGEPCAATYDVDEYPGERNQGRCQPGRLMCDPEGSGELVCVDALGPEPEVCDGIDNDCDGQIDEAGPPPDGIDGTADPEDDSRHLGDECGAAEGVCERGTLGCINGQVVCQGGLGAQLEECNCIDDDCDGETDEEDPPICSPGKSCVKLDDICVCAARCASGEFACATGMDCEPVPRSNDGAIADYCVPEAPCADCSSRTVVDANGRVECAPATQLIPGKPVPVCECKSQACHSPCFGVPCDDGQACVPTGWARGTCRANDCYFQGCDVGQVCLDGDCEKDLCASAPCEDNQACKPASTKQGYECVASCAGVECKATERCVEGKCVATGCDEKCKSGEVCLAKGDHAGECGPSLCEVKDGRPTCSDGSYCDPTTGACGDDPCAGVHCPKGQQCEAGQCVSDEIAPWLGSGGSSEDASSPASSEARWGLTSGGGGCSCRLSSSRHDALWWLGLASLFGLTQRRKRGRVAPGNGRRAS